MVASVSFSRMAAEVDANRYKAPQGRDYSIFSDTKIALDATDIRRAVRFGEF